MIVLLSSTVETVMLIVYEVTNTQVNVHDTDVDTGTHDLPVNGELKSRSLKLRAA